MLVIDLHGIRIPSINHKYQVNRKTGGLFLAKAYRDFKIMLTLEAKRFVNLRMPRAPYYVKIMAYTSKDIDNFVKIVLDALQAAGVIDDDKNVVELLLVKIPVKRGQPEDLEVRLQTMIPGLS